MVSHQAPTGFGLGSGIDPRTVLGELHSFGVFSSLQFLLVGRMMIPTFTHSRDTPGMHALTLSGSGKDGSKDAFSSIHLMWLGGPLILTS